MEAERPRKYHWKSLSLAATQSAVLDPCGQPAVASLLRAVYWELLLWSEIMWRTKKKVFISQVKMTKLQDFLLIGVKGFGGTDINLFPANPGCSDPLKWVNLKSKFLPSMPKELCPTWGHFFFKHSYVAMSITRSCFSFPSSKLSKRQQIWNMEAALTLTISKECWYGVLGFLTYC